VSSLVSSLDAGDAAIVWMQVESFAKSLNERAWAEFGTLLFDRRLLHS
jgi:hypothetical protein